MTLLTKGMGAIIKGALKKGTKSIKQGITAPKTNIPLYVASGTVLAGRIAYEKAKEKIKKKKKDKDKE
jgi:hypothetical protein